MEEYAVPGRLLRPVIKLRTVKCHKPLIGASAACYLELNKYLSEIGMVRLQKSRPVVVNGMFEVDKDRGIQRLIIDNINANLVFKEPKI